MHLLKVASDGSSTEMQGGPRAEGI